MTTSARLTALFAERSGAPLIADDIERRIIEAAATCFIRDGVGKTTMVGIADEAGVGVATVYRRFGQKDNLVQTTLLMEIHRFLDTLTERLADAGSPEDQLAEGFATFVAAVANRPLLVDALERDEAANLLPIMTAGASPFLAIGTTYIAGLIERWQSAYGLDNTYDPKLIAEIFARLAHSLALTPDGRIPVTDEVAARMFARTYLLPLLHPSGALAAQS